VLKIRLSLAGVEGDDSFIFGLWLFAGLIPWIAFTGALTQAAGSVVGQPNLVKKVVFPLVLLPLVPVLTAFVESMFGLALLIAFVALVTGTLQPTLALLPLVWLPQLLLTAGLGYFIAGVTAYLRDIPQIIAVLINLWFYLTPIVYPASIIPNSVRPWVFRLNPLATLVEVYRDIILSGDLTYWREWSILMVVSIMVFKIGLSVYQRLRPGFADVL
jgi:lipopolysaccharide transport system permease protein